MGRKLIKAIKLLLKYAGFYPEQLVTNLKSIPWFFRDYKKLKGQLSSSDHSFKLGVPMPQLMDKYDSSGTLSGHYFHQDLLVAQRIFKNNPKRHVDIGSRTDGFVTHVAAFREIEVFDIRSYEVSIPNIRFVQADFMNMTPELKNYTDSISCLHVIEHFGLGRYGDPIDVDGHLKGLENMKSMLKTGGTFYFSTPIGEQRINFNAHRVFSVRYLTDLFLKDYTIESFSYVDDKGAIHREVQWEEGITNNFNCVFGCGIFEMRKR